MELTYMAAYTTTTRRLRDPAAQRLENLWWRVWGSQRRHLHATTIAAIVRVVSDSDNTVSSQRTRAHAATAAPRDASPDTQSSEDPWSAASSTILRDPVVIHPILKKGRGSSSNGPRPTARFVDPHDVAGPGGEDEHAVATTPPSRPPTRKPSGLRTTPTSSQKKKSQGFVASAGKKRRPHAARRHSSGTSTTSGPSGSPEKAVAGPVASRAHPMVRTPSGDGTSPTRSRETMAAILRMTPADTGKRGLPPAHRRPDMYMESSEDESPLPSSHAQAIPSSRTSAYTNLTAKELAEMHAQQELLAQFSMSIRSSSQRHRPVAIAASQTTTTTTTNPILDEWSQVPRGSRRSKSDGSLATQRLLPDHNQAKSRASLATSLSLACGQMHDTSPTPPGNTSPTRLDDAGRRLSSFSIPSTIREEPAGSEHDAGPHAPLPMIRSRSHLSSLLVRSESRKSTSPEKKRSR